MRFCRHPSVTSSILCVGAVGEMWKSLFCSVSAHCSQTSRPCTKIFKSSIHLGKHVFCTCCKPLSSEDSENHTSTLDLQRIPTRIFVFRSRLVLLKVSDFEEKENGGRGGVLLCGSSSIREWVHLMHLQLEIKFKILTDFERNVPWGMETHFEFRQRPFLGRAAEWGMTCAPHCRRYCCRYGTPCFFRSPHCSASSTLISAFVSV